MKLLLSVFFFLLSAINIHWSKRNTTKYPSWKPSTWKTEESKGKKKSLRKKKIEIYRSVERNGSFLAKFAAFKASIGSKLSFKSELKETDKSDSAAGAGVQGGGRFPAAFAFPTADFHQPVDAEINSNYIYFASR